MCRRPLGGAVKLIRDLKEVSEPVARVTWESFTAASGVAVKKVRSCLSSNEWIYLSDGQKNSTVTQEAEYICTIKCFGSGWWEGGVSVFSKGSGTLYRSVCRQTRPLEHTELLAWCFGCKLAASTAGVGLFVCFNFSEAANRLQSESECFLQTGNLSRLSAGVALTSTICSAGCQVGKPTCS